MYFFILKMLRKIPIVMLLSLLALVACKPEKPPIRNASRAVQTLQLGNKNLRYTWYDGDRFQNTNLIGKIPFKFRRVVQLLDVTAPPRQDDLVAVADLTHPGAGGRLAYRLLQRRVFEKAARAAAPPPEPLALDGGPAQAILYQTSWCPVCTRARNYLISKKVPFLDKDIEKDRAAAAELAAKSRKQGVPLGGVPVIDIGGRLIRGFNRGAIDSLLAQLRVKSPPKK